MQEYLELPDEPTRAERDKLFALSARTEAGPGPFDLEFLSVCRRVVPRLQRQILRLERLEREVQLTALHEPEVQAAQKPRKAKSA